MRMEERKPARKLEDETPTRMTSKYTDPVKFLCSVLFDVVNTVEVTLKNKYRRGKLTSSSSSSSPHNVELSRLVVLVVAVFYEATTHRTM